jgi:Protein of unknown function (DUF1236)
MRFHLTLGLIAVGLLASVDIADMPAFGQDNTVSPGLAAPPPTLSPTQRAAIFTAVSKEKSKVAPPLAFNPAVGAKVPPSIALYPMPDSTLADIPAIRPYQYTVIKDQVVLVDPTTLQVVDIIRP